MPGNIDFEGGFEWPPEVEFDPKVNQLAAEVIQWKLTQDQEAKKTTIHRFGANALPECAATESMIFSGNGATNDKGIWKLDLVMVKCIYPEHHLLRPHTVATPVSLRPRLLTTGFKLTTNSDGVTTSLELIIRSWLPGGDVDKFCEFDWHSVVPVTTKIGLI